MVPNRIQLSLVTRHTMVLNRIRLSIIARHTMVANRIRLWFLIVFDYGPYSYSTMAPIHIQTAMFVWSLIISRHSIIQWLA